MNKNINKLNNNITNCIKCKRLVGFRRKIALEKRKQFINETYWGKPITGFGDINGKILFQADIDKEQIFNISLNDGLYIYKIKNQKSTTKTGKFIVKND